MPFMTEIEYVCSSWIPDPALTIEILNDVKLYLQRIKS